jgi:hypothetical protein
MGNVEGDNAGSIFLQATLQATANSILLCLCTVPCCAVAFQNLAAAQQPHQEHNAADMHSSKQQLEFDAITICNTM